MNERKVVIAGGKYDGPNLARLKLHEEYGRVWLYLTDDEGTSLQNGRLLCIDDDGYVRIHAEYTVLANGLPTRMPPESFEIRLKWPKEAT